MFDCIMVGNSIHVWYKAVDQPSSVALLLPAVCSCIKEVTVQCYQLYLYYYCKWDKKLFLLIEFHLPNCCSCFAHTFLHFFFHSQRRSVDWKEGGRWRWWSYAQCKCELFRDTNFDAQVSLVRWERTKGSIDVPQCLTKCLFVVSVGGWQECCGDCVCR